MKIVEAHQVPIGCISPDIFALPCVVHAYKADDGVDYICILNTPENDFIDIKRATIFDWIYKTDDGKWHVSTNDEYQRIKYIEQ